MEWVRENIVNIVEFINNELSKGRSMASIEREEFGVSERVIHKRLIRLNYKRVNNQYRPKSDITSNITVEKVTQNHKETKEAPSNINNITSNITANIDVDKLNLLLDNLEKILKLIPADDLENGTELRSGVNDVKSFRVDSNLYSLIKKRAVRDGINISDILNKALEDYLKNYL